jgi:hypothetical protein
MEILILVILILPCYFHLSKTFIEKRTMTRLIKLIEIENKHILEHKRMRVELGTNFKSMTLTFYL